MLGRGGMGSVWAADHLALKTEVAVKFMSAMYAEDPAMLTRFEREATSAAQIKSPHIVNVHDHGVTGDGIPYMVMELLEGEDLSVRIKRAGPLPLDEVAEVIAQTCKALGKAHKLGIVHRDIKPSNIFLLDTEGGDIFVKVLDFGVAKPGSESDVTNTGLIVGTIVYASPEQLLNAKKVDHRADLWSVGVVAYRALTGKLPFSDDDGIGSLCLAMQQGMFTRPSALVPDLPLEVDRWFEKAFKRDPDERFTTAVEMARELFQACGRAEAPSLSMRMRTGGVDSSNDPGLRQLTTGGQTEVDSGPEIEFEDAKATVITSPSGVALREGTAAGYEPLSTTAVPGALAAKRKQKQKARDTGRDPNTLGTSSAMTFPGTDAPPPPSVPAPQGSAFRKVVLALAAVACLAGGGVAGLVLLKRTGPPLPGMPGSIAADPAPAAPVPAPPIAKAVDVPSTEAPPAVVPASSRAELAPPSAPSAPSASPTTTPTASAAAVPTASAVAPASTAPQSGPKNPGRPGGSGRNPLPEKDYGF
ncbi:serine/threonine-protein kinase [Polyangium aurulentum]|uniref:serine/threonine-protein kinase n=1 Tax=Polyangium aurulentum TaxID=2567896 RepID=UPI0023DF757E|nr:serine/threonine-protein kinase [Polyangium aurulentum]